jgi:mannose-6-phosphate isomerase class I
MDPNPKPEVAVALTDDFTACFGFATAETLASNFEKSATLRSIVSECTEGKYQQCLPDSAEWLKDFVYGLFNRLEANQERLAQVINGLREESEALEPGHRSIH